MTTEPPPVPPPDPGQGTWWSPPDPSWAPPPEPAARRSRAGLWITLVVVVVLLVPLVAVVIVYSAGQIVRATRDDGVSSASAGCRPDTFEDGSGNRHVAIGQPIDYPQTPPASGRHWGNFLQGLEIRTLYTVEDRPPVERLVHSLEHGYSILWYDADVAEDPDRMDLLADIAASAPTKFMAAPWTDADGDPFPPGVDLVLVHWSFGDRAGGAEPASLADAEPRSTPLGVRRACADLSLEVVEEFMADYPFTDSLEPYAP